MSCRRSAVLTGLIVALPISRKIRRLALASFLLTACQSQAPVDDSAASEDDDEDEEGGGEGGSSEAADGGHGGEHMGEGTRGVEGHDPQAREDSGATPDAANVSTPPPAFSCAGRAICQTFETFPAGGVHSLGTVRITSGSKLVVEDGKAYSGTKALRVEGNPQGAKSATALLSIDVKALWAKSRTLYVRMMVQPETLAPGEGHWDIVQMHGQVSGENNYGAMVSYGGFGAYRAKLLYIGKPLSWADCSLSAQRFFPANRWTCLEIKLDKNDPAQAYGISFNSTVVPQLTTGTRPQNSNCVAGLDRIAGHWQVPDIDTVAIGYHHIHEQLAPYRFWIDDLVIDDKPVGCPMRP